MKKAWEKPKLVVLVRARPEEGVLTACKTTGGATSPNPSNIGCEKGNCTSCAAWAST